MGEKTSFLRVQERHAYMRDTRFKLKAPMVLEQA